MNTKTLYINGEWRSPVNGGTREIINPADNSVLETVGDADAADAELAIDAARRQFDSGEWPNTPAGARAALLFKLADSIEAHAEELAVLDTKNNGKPLREARYDAADAAGCFRYYAGLATKALGQTYEVSDPAIMSMVVREPIGVCAQIIPWNYPLLMASWKLAPGLAAGNCCILKCAESTPLSAIKLFECIHEIGFPKGTVQLLMGPGPTVGHALAASHKVDKVAFTGGTVTGRKIMEAAAGNIKKISLELGGKSPNIIFADADPDMALEYALFGIFAGQGEVCSAGSRLLVEKSMAAEFLPRLAAAAQRIAVGNGMDESSEMGPLITKAHTEKVMAYIQTGVEEGARLLCGGSRVEGNGREKGNFVSPTIFADTKPEMRIVKEEIFGPVLVVQTFESEEEAIQIANNTEYGLAGAVFTRDNGKGLRVLKKLRAGITWLNTYHPTFNEAPWGGYKQSGIGRELGTFGLEQYLETKQINVNTSSARLGWFSRALERKGT